MLRIALLLGLVLPLACAASEKPKPKSEEDIDLAFVRAPPVLVPGFKQPDSVVHEPASDVYLVSNMNGDPLDKKSDNGFISKVSPEGKVLEMKWIDGAASKFTLNAPKGMAVVGRRLYVADIDSVRMFDLKRGNAVGRIRIPRATYLNDVSADASGNVYVSDTGLEVGEKGLEPSDNAAIFRISKYGALKRLATGPDLKQPSGVFADKNGVWVVTHGADQLFHLSRSGERDASFTLPLGRLEGLITANDGRFLVSSSRRGAVLEGFSGTAFRTTIKNVKHAGSLGFDSGRGCVLIPLRKRNELMIQQLSAFE